MQSRTRGGFVTACQQLLALAVVVTVLTPAASTISMDVRPAAPGTAHPVAQAYLRAATVPSKVPAAPVEPDVTEHGLTAPEGARVSPASLEVASRRATGTGLELVSDPVAVEGYGAVGVTWAHGETLADDDIAVQARTYQDSAWSGWTDVQYHEEHGPDPDSREALEARPGTSPLLVGEVDRVQVRVTATRAPHDMRLAVVDPGEAASSAREVPSIDTDALDGGDVVPAPAASTDADDADALTLQAQVAASKPRIFSRAQWGADESMRDPGSLHFHEVHAGFVHHTVNANDYSRAQVPGIIRGIYAYHTRSQGWSDIGYNFLVDRFGRIWEGRYGGVDRPVVGAHTLGYNENSFAMSAIGNFETAQPSQALLEAYGALFAWKLALHGVDASSSRQYVSTRNFQAINGHRDAGSTACPGRNLYAKIPQIRTLAAERQRGWEGRELESDLVGKAKPDLVVRRASDGRGFLLPLLGKKGSYRLGAPVDTGLDLGDARNVMKAGDWDLDGVGDLLVRRRGAGTLFLHRGRGDGTFEAGEAIAEGFKRVLKLAAVGDMTGDGKPDLMGQPKGQPLMIYPGKGLDGLRARYPAYSTVPGKKQVPIGRWDGDGAPDTFMRTPDGLTLYRGNGPGGLTGSKKMGLDISGYSWLVGISDIGIKGHADLVARSKDGQLWLIPGTVDGFRARLQISGDVSKYDLAG